MYKFNYEEVMSNESNIIEADRFANGVIEAKVMLISQTIGDLETFLVDKGLSTEKFKYSLNEIIKRSMFDFESTEFDCLSFVISKADNFEAGYLRIWLGDEITWDLSSEGYCDPVSYEYEELNIRREYFNPELKLTIESDSVIPVVMEIDKGHKRTKCHFKIRDMKTDLIQGKSNLIYELVNDEKRKDFVESIGQAIFTSAQMYRSMRGI